MGGGVGCGIVEFVLKLRVVVVDGWTDAGR